MHRPITADCQSQYAEGRQGETTAHLVPPSRERPPRDIGAQPDPQDLVQAPSSRRLSTTRMPKHPFRRVSHAIDLRGERPVPLYWPLNCHCNMRRSCAARTSWLTLPFSTPPPTLQGESPDLMCSEAQAAFCS